MKTKLTFISAGAGSGKTYRLTNILYTELAAKRVSPGGVMATTFTRKAATELRERVRGFMLERGEHALANAMGQAQIGTINAVCGDLLRRFAFEAGLPTEQTVLEEEQATLLLRQAIDMVQESEQAAELDVLRRRLSIEDWDDDFKNLVSTIRANDIDPGQLAMIAQENADDLLSHFPKATKDDLTKELSDALNHAIPLIQASAGNIKVTAAYLELAQALKRDLQYGDAHWSDWIKISKENPAAALKPLAAPIRDIAERTPSHPDLHKDLRAYLTCQFDLAARVLDVYNKIKIERGVIDFTDQEQLLLKLLDNPFIAETLGSELDLLMVDEFQDTSPIQLALFLRLAQFAKQVYWVGDIKQAIYGFRGSDTELMSSILQELPALGGIKETLNQSWRSRKPLVDLVNGVFVPAFAGSMREGDVALIAERDEPLKEAPFASWHLNGNAEQQISELGQALQQMIQAGYSVYDKELKCIRPATFGDIAILRRSNNSVTDTARGLRAAGIAAMTAQPGLLSTPEAVLAIACLRRLNDAYDTLASAEIIALSECDEPEQWISDRLNYLTDAAPSHLWRESGDNAHQILEQLARLRIDMPIMAPAEALETAIAACHIPNIVLQWNGSVNIGRVRLANLDALIALARQYETICTGSKQAASVSGLLLWFKEQEKGGTDSMALPAIDAVQVLTHHKAKGLEWPIVILMDTQGEVKDGLWNSLRAASRHAIQAADPLRDRTLRLWPWPFGKQQKVPVREEIAQSPTAQKFHTLANEEAKRVLYVSMTRARDLMIFAMPAKKSSGPWLETLEADWLLSTDENDCITLPSGEKIQTMPMPEISETISEKPFEQLWWFGASTKQKERLPRTFNPSKADSPAMTITQTASLGQRIEVGSKVDWAIVGHAVHAAIALAFVDRSQPITIHDVERILKSYQLSAHISASALVSQITVIIDWIAQQWPGTTIFPEWPVEAILPSGQILNGRIDLLIDAGTHWILLDHKSNPGARSSWDKLADEYGGQLLAYKQALEIATGKPVKEMWLLLPIAAGAICIEQTA